MRDLKEAGVQNCHLSEREPVVGIHGRAGRREPPKPDELAVTGGCRAGGYGLL